jgi:hypothetical protein
MGNINQLIYLERYEEEFEGPFLEVGSKNYGSTQDLRAIFAHQDKYIGIDQEAGPNVDVVLDFTEDFEQIDKKLRGQRFGTVFCLSVLEHCEKPYKMAENLTLLLKKAGFICVSAPFSWKVHNYPKDYWRFTPEGIKNLFPRIDFNMKKSVAFTSKKNEFQKLDRDFGRICFSFKKHCESGHVLRGVSAKILKMLSRIGILNWITGYRYLIAPTSVLMMGKLKDI